MNQDLITFIAKDRAATIDVRLKGETVWLSLNELAQLFERDKSVISRHIKKIFQNQELIRDAVVAFFATTGPDGKTYQVEHFNLDMIISLGYRVNSKRGIEFRQWATSILKDYLVQGYSLSQWQLERKGVSDLSRALELLGKTLEQNQLISDVGVASLEIIGQFARSWSLLLAYDEFRLPAPSADQRPELSFSYRDIVMCVHMLKDKLTEAHEASELFGLERGDAALQGILGNIDQTFAGQLLYKSARERAAHLFYFVIKDHPFCDGNKRIGAFLFLVYLKLQGIQSPNMTDSTLVAMALMIAESNPRDKDLMIALTVNLI